MTPDRWHEVERLYHAALERGEEERADFLSTECAGDEELRREVESLLEHEADAEHFIDSPALETAARLMASEHAAALTAGQRVNQYEVISSIGAGGMGEVYLAKDTKLQRRVAIKMLPAQSARDPQSIRRFISEAKTASSLNHPNIVTIYEIDDHGDVPFIVMEYIDGESLRASAGSPMPLEKFLDQAIQITSAIAAAHEAGIVHRDIKPANVMLSRSGHIKVVDFGLARLSQPLTPLGEDQSTAEWQSRITKSGAIVGTLGYMSPEQIQGQNVDARSDVFSLGVLFHEMLSGQRLFKADDPMSATAAILRDDPPSLRTVRKVIPPELEKLIKRALVKDPKIRDITAAQMHDELVALRDSLRPAGKGARTRFYLAIAATVLLLVAGAAFWWWQQSRQRWLRNYALPEIQRLTDAEDFYGAYVLALEAREVAPDDPQLEQAWANLSVPLEILSEPPGADVSMHSYGESEGEWTRLGRTPLNMRVPISMVRFRVTLDGHVPLEAAPPTFAGSHTFRMHRQNETPAGMVPVTAGSASFRGVSVDLPPFWIDRYEVSNEEFKRFIDEGGYRRKELWKHSMEREGRTLAWEDAVREFVDSTGRPGPSHWELGTYPEGEGQHPVDGISWYEAAAYAEFVGKSLPTVYHWYKASGITGFSDILRLSNFSGKGTLPTGSTRGLGPWGTYDMAGNVKEWCFNAVGEQRFILGGSQADPPYQFMDPDAQFPGARQRGFGMRLILQQTPIAESLQPITIDRNRVDEPVNEETFQLFVNSYDYDASPLNAKTDSIDESQPMWRREIISIDAAYGGERLPVNLFIPRNASPPYQTVVYFPGSDASVATSRHMRLLPVEFFVRSGRAVAFPVYKGTYERTVPDPSGPVGWRDLTIQRVKDVRRTLDYLETRKDLEPGRFAYYGFSMGANIAPVVLGVEPRFEAAILVAGGLKKRNVSPEAQPGNFVSRVRMPVLILTGRHDFSAPYETEQKPLFEMLGTPPENKRHVVYEAGHVPQPWTEVIRESLEWADRWMGPVNAPSPVR